MVLEFYSLKSLNDVCLLNGKCIAELLVLLTNTFSMSHEILSIIMTRDFFQLNVEMGYLLSTLMGKGGRLLHDVHEHSIYLHVCNIGHGLESGV